MHNLSMPFLYIDFSPVQLLIYNIYYIEDMGRRGFRLSAPKDWVRRKYQQPGNLVIKISRCLADAVLFVAQVRLCDLKGWNLVHASVSEGVRMCKLDSKGQLTYVAHTTFHLNQDMNLVMRVPAGQRGGCLVLHRSLLMMYAIFFAPKVLLTLRGPKKPRHSGHVTPNFGGDELNSVTNLWI